MKSRRWFVGPLGLIAFVAGCETILGIEDGKLRPEAECTTIADCIDEMPACRAVASCTEGKCVFQDVPAGTPLPDQVVGDCLDLVCDGNGSMKQNNAFEDNDDGNPCTKDSCNGVTPVHVPQQSFPCYTGPFGTNGVGICGEGTQQCAQDGTPIGTCEKETLPATSDGCDVKNGLDDDCDGEIDEDCFCGDGKVTPEIGEVFARWMGV